VGKQYLDLPFLLLARLGTLAKVITPINQSMIGKYSYCFTKKKKDHTASRRKKIGKEMKIILIIV